MTDKIFKTQNASRLVLLNKIKKQASDKENYVYNYKNSRRKLSRAMNRWHCHQLFVKKNLVWKHLTRLVQNIHLLSSGLLKYSRSTHFVNMECGNLLFDKLSCCPLAVLFSFHVGKHLCSAKFVFWHGVKSCSKICDVCWTLRLLFSVFRFARN